MMSAAVPGGRGFLWKIGQVRQLPDCRLLGNGGDASARCYRARYRTVTQSN